MATYLSQRDKQLLRQSHSSPAPPSPALQQRGYTTLPCPPGSMHSLQSNQIFRGPWLCEEARGVKGAYSEGLSASISRRILERTELNWSKSTSFLHISLFLSKLATFFLTPSFSSSAFFPKNNLDSLPLHPHPTVKRLPATTLPPVPILSTTQIRDMMLSKKDMAPALTPLTV